MPRFTPKLSSWLRVDMKRAFLSTVLVMCSLQGCASFGNGELKSFMVGFVETVVSSSIEYLRDHPEALRMSLSDDATVSSDASVDDVSEVSTDR